MTGEILLKILAFAFPAVEFLGILTAIHAAVHARSSQGAIAWAVSLVTFPWVSLPLYWIFGRGKFHGYVEVLRAGRREHADRVEAVMRLLATDGAVARKDVEPGHRVFEQLAGWPFNEGNRVELLVDGEATFTSMFEAIDSARNYVLLQYFIVRDDDLGRELRATLARKVAQGVRVFLLYDEIGSHSLPRRYLDELRSDGVRVSSFHTTRGRRNRFQINFRNHRKITVVDGTTAFVGGHNIGDEYRGRSRRFGPWRDTHVKIVGPAARNVQAVFLGDWYWATREGIELEWPTEFPESGETRVLVVPTGPTDEVQTCSLLFLQAIHSARSRIWIASPYFVPDDAIVEALQLAALRGVDVRILLPMRPDHRIVYLASFFYLKWLDLPGIRFYRYEYGFLHQKVFLVDDDLAAVGTANLDNRSLHLNFELTILGVGSGSARRVEEMLERDFSRSRKVTVEDYHRRSVLFKTGVSVARLFSPVL
jgi:cardiolipin synthase